jgi:hypothetical protein
LLGAMQGAAAATMPLFCCGGIPPDDATTMQAGVDCGDTCSLCAVCHSTSAVPPPLAHAPCSPSLRVSMASTDLLPFALEPIHRPPRT